MPHTQAKTMPAADSRRAPSSMKVLAIRSVELADKQGIRSSTLPADVSPTTYDGYECLVVTYSFVIDGKRVRAIDCDGYPTNELIDLLGVRQTIALMRCVKCSLTITDRTTGKVIKPASDGKTYTAANQDVLFIDRDLPGRFFAKFTMHSSDIVISSQGQKGGPPFVVTGASEVLCCQGDKEHPGFHYDIVASICEDAAEVICACCEDEDETSATAVRRLVARGDALSAAVKPSADWIVAQRFSLWATLADDDDEPYVDYFPVIEKALLAQDVGRRVCARALNDASPAAESGSMTQKELFKPLFEHKSAIDAICNRIVDFVRYEAFVPTEFLGEAPWSNDDIQAAIDLTGKLRTWCGDKVRDTLKQHLSDAGSMGSRS
jgi:hypothetical protein